MGKKEATSGDDDSVELSAQVSAEGIGGKVHVGHIRRLVSLIAPQHVARVELIEAAAAGVGAKIRAGDWSKITDEERVLAGFILQDRADAFVRRAQIEERAEKAYEEVSVRLLPSISPAKPKDERVDPDWLRRFWKDAEVVSHEDVQELYARILAGEHVKPGSFSLRALDVIRTLDRETAELFQTFRNHMLGVLVPGPDTPPGKHMGFTALHVALLREAGLVDTTERVLGTELRFDYGDRRLIARSKAAKNDRFSFGLEMVHRPTVAGAQLGEVACFQPDYEYFDVVVAWLRGLKFEVAVSRIDDVTPVED